MTKDINGIRFVTWKGFIFAIIMIVGSLGTLSGYVLHAVAYDKPTGAVLGEKVEMMQQEIIEIKTILTRQAETMAELNLVNTRILMVLEHIQGQHVIIHPSSKRHAPP